MRLNKIIKFNCILNALLCVFAANTYAQDIHFSQFDMSPLTLNPSTAGAFKDIIATTNFRDQWKSVSNPYKTFAISYDMKILKDRYQNSVFGIGINVFNDRAGDGSLNTAQANISIASHLKINEHQSLSAGIQGGFGQRSINFSSLTWDNQFNGFAYDASLPSNEPMASNSFLYPDLGAGVLWQYKKREMYMSGNDDVRSSIGFSVSHVNKPKFSFYPTTNNFLYMKYVLHGNLWYGIKGTSVSFVPGFIFYRQGPAQEIQAGSLISYTLSENSRYTSFVAHRTIAAGAYYRWNDAVVIATLLEMANYAIGISYDVNVSALRKASYGRGGFEISLRYVFPANGISDAAARF